MEKEMIRNKFVSITNEINGSPKEADFQVITTNIDVSSVIKQGSNAILVRCLQFSIDPYQLNRMKSYCPSHNSVAAAAKLLPGTPIDGNGIGKVIASGHPDFQKDDLISGLLNWAQYVVVENTKLIRKIDLCGFPMSYHLGTLGISGLTAYSGFFKVGKPKKGEKIFVSTASGSVGNVVGQYAKLIGCYVVGCAGTSQKVALLKDKLGFDDAFNYKEETDLNLTLKRYFPEGIDVYFDNVGGEMLEAAISNMNTYGRAVICGAISQYTGLTKNKAAPDLINIIYKRITIQGFVLTDYQDDHTYAEFFSATSKYVRGGRMQVLEDIIFGLESIPSAFIGLFYGCNVGKTIVKIADD